MNKAPMSWLLRVYSGPHSGAEVVLTAGEQLIGAGEQCDIILDDPLIAEQHLCLRVHSESVDLSPIESAVFVDGELATEGALSAFAIVQLGKTQFAIGPEDAEWPEVDLPALQDMKDVGDQVASDENEESPAEEGEDALDDTQEDAQELSPAASAPATRSGGVGRWLASTVVIVILLLGGLFVAIETGWLNASADTAEREVSLEELEAVVAKVAPDSTVQIEEKNGRFEASGFVMTRDDERQLIDALLSVDRFADVAEVDDMEGKVKLAQGMLRFGDLKDLVISARRPGELVVSGRLNDLQPWNAKRREIEDRARVLIADEVESPETRPPQQVPTTVPQPPDPVASGNSPQSSLTPIQPSEESITQPTEEAEVQAPLLVRDVTIGRNRFLTTVAGYDVHEGSLIFGGFVVKSILSDRVVLSKDGSEFILRFEVQP